MEIQELIQLHLLENLTLLHQQVVEVEEDLLLETLTQLYLEDQVEVDLLGVLDHTQVDVGQLIKVLVVVLIQVHQVDLLVAAVEVEQELLVVMVLVHLLLVMVVMV
jgi:hypothetical protein